MIALHECETMTGVSTQEGADTLMIHHAVELASNGMNVHIYPQDTDVLFLALRRTSLLIMGTTERRRKIFIQPMYDKLGPEKSGPLINWHALTGSDTKGHIHEKGKNGCFVTFKKTKPTTMISLSGHGQGDEPSEEVLRNTLKSFFALFSLQVESALGKQRCAGGFCSINSEMNKELTNCQRPMEHGLNICAVLMSRLIDDTMI